MKESDMYLPVKQFLLTELKCDRVVAEILDFDVLGLYGDQHNVIVEMKRGLNFKVIQQAIRAKQYAHWVYIAVIRPTSQSSEHEWVYNEFLKPNGIGLLYVTDPDKQYQYWSNRVNETNQVRFAIEQHPQRWASPSLTDPLRNISVAKYNRLPNTKRPVWHNQKAVQTHADYIRSDIPEWADENIGGVKGGDALKVTGYSKLMDCVKTFLEEHNQYKESTGIHVKSIANHIPMAQSHYGNPVTSLRATLQESWNRDWIDIEHYKKEKVFRLNYSKKESPA